MIQSAFRAQEVNPAKLVQLYRREFELCRVKKGETIAVVSDLATRREYIQAACEAGTDLTYECGEYPVMTQWGYADERGHFDHWGGGHIHTFPNEGGAHGTVMLQPGDIVILPYCRYVADAVKLEIREGHITNIQG